MADRYFVERDVRARLKRIGVEPTRMTFTERDDINALTRSGKAMVDFRIHRRLPQSVQVVVWLPRRLAPQERAILQGADAPGVSIDIRDNVP